MLSTSLRTPTATGLVVNQWTTPANAFASNDAYAFPGLLGQQQDYYNFGFSVPTDAVISGILINCEVHSFNVNLAEMQVDLSSDNGATYTTGSESIQVYGTNDQVITTESMVYTWGRSWVPSDFNDGSFMVRVTAGPAGTRIYLDVIRAIVYFTVPKTVEPTHHQSLGLSVLAYKPTIGSGTYSVRGTLVDDQIASKADAISFEKHADGGWWSAQITLNAQLVDAEQWFEEGVNTHIDIYNPALVRIFSGFVNQVDLTAGALAATRGPLLDVSNRLSVTYTPILDATISPPIYGVETTTTVQDDTSSQALYGVLEAVYGSEPGRCLQTRAEQQRDTYLEELKNAKTSEDAGFSATNVTQVVLNVLGYRHRLGKYVHQNTTAASVALSTKIQQVLASDPNGLFSTDYTGIATNAFLVDQYENDNRMANDVITDLVAIGGATSDERWTFGIYDDERAVYDAIPTEAIYQHRIADRYRRIEQFGTGELVRPWDVQPGQFLFFPDFLIGRTQPASLRDDPRYLFIETVTFSTPYEIQINGTQLSTIPQLLAKARTLE